MSAREFAVEVPGLVLRGLEFGAGKPLLALHGWLDNAASFVPLAAHLPRRRLLALDLAGHGRSDHRSADAGYHFIDWVPDVIAAADSLGLERFDIMGHSMGASIATLTAATFPQRIGKVVLIDGLAPAPTPPSEVPKTLRRFIEAQQRQRARQPTPHVDRATMVERLREVATDLTETAADLLVARGSKALRSGVGWSYDPRLRRISSMRFSPEHIRAFLQAVEAPTLFLRAHNGFPIDDSTLATAESWVPDLTKRVVEGRHHVHMDTPEVLAPLIEAFLQVGSKLAEENTKPGSQATGA